eukprot:2941042-Pleurochrysis_carterae.AAC.1
MRCNLLSSRSLSLHLAPSRFLFFHDYVLAQVKRHAREDTASNIAKRKSSGKPGAPASASASASASGSGSRRSVGVRRQQVAALGSLLHDRDSSEDEEEEDETGGKDDTEVQPGCKNDGTE